MKTGLIICAVLLVAAIAYIAIQQQKISNITNDANALASEWDNIALGNPPSLYNQTTKAPAVTFTTYVWTPAGLLAPPGTTVAANVNPFTGNQQLPAATS